MAKNRNQKGSRRKKGGSRLIKFGLPQVAQQRLRAAMVLSAQGEHSDAREILAGLNYRYPDRIEILGELYNQCAHLDDLRGIERSAARLLRLYPQDPGVTGALSRGYIFLGRMALASRILRRLIECWPGHEEALFARSILPRVEAIAHQRAEEAGFDGEDAVQLAELHEESLSLLDQSDYRAVRGTIERILALRPNLASAENILSLIAMAEGKLEEAIEIAENVLRRDDRDPQALANLVRFMVMSGDAARARLYGDRLRAIDLGLPEVWIRKAEAFSFLGDDAAVLQILPEIEEEEETFSLPSAAGVVFHFAAVSTLRLEPDNEMAREKARNLWEKASDICEGLEVVESNLDDLNRAVGKRHGPWPFRLEDWVRPEVVYELAERLRLISDGDLSARTREVRSFLARRPEVERLVPILLERGDPEGRSFAINLATIGQTPELLSALQDFVFSRNGPDQSRIEATEVLLRTGQMQPGTHQVWIKGRWQKSLIMGAIIHGEPVKNVGKRAMPLADQGLHALHAENGVQAESLFRQALLIEPDNPMLINNLISSLDLQGRVCEAEEMMVELHRQFPDYLFGRIAMAALATKRGEFDRAQEYLNPLYERHRLHFSEFRALAFARIDLALARGDREDARLWFEHLEQIYPDARRLENYRLRVRDPSAAKDQE